MSVEEAKQHIKENYSIIYKRRSVQISRLPDLRQFGSDWAKNNASPWQKDQGWLQVVEELDLMLESDNEDDRVLLERLLAYIQQPSRYNYYQIEQLHQLPHQWTRRYLFLSYALFDEAMTTMFFAESDHPNLDMVVAKLHPYLSVIVDTDARGGRTPTFLRNLTPKYITPLNVETYGKRKINERSNDPMICPTVWDRISLAQYANSEQSAALILDKVDSEQIRRSFDRISIYNRYVMPFYERAGVSDSELLPHAIVVGYGPILERGFRRLDAEEFDRDKIRLYLRDLLNYENKESFELVLAILASSKRKKEYGTILWDVMIDGLSRGSIYNPASIHRFFPLEQPIVLDDEQTYTLIDADNEELIAAYLDCGVVLPEGIMIEINNQETEITPFEQTIYEGYLNSFKAIANRMPKSQALEQTIDFLITHPTASSVIESLVYLLNHYHYTPSELQEARDNSRTRQLDRYCDS